MSILDPKRHARLIEEMDDVARTAGIPKRYIEESMTDHCTEVEIDWVKGYRDHAYKGRYGLCYVGVDHTTRMMAIAGAFTRNFVLAQMETVSDLIEGLRNGISPSASVLLVPTFHRPGGGLTPYQLNHLWALLEDRMISQRQTVIGVSSLQQLSAEYGPHFKQLVDSHYEICTS